MEDFNIDDYRSARKQNQKQFAIYGLILAAFIASTVYLLYSSTQEKERYSVSKEAIENAMIRSVDSLELLLSKSLTTNEKLIGEIESQNEEIKKNASQPTSSPNVGVKQINVSEAVSQSASIRKKLDQQRPSLNDLSFSYYSNRKIDPKNVDVSAFSNVRQSSNLKELAFSPFGKSKYEIYYSEDADLSAALAIQTKLRNKKINAALYKVPKTNKKNEVVLVH